MRGRFGATALLACLFITPAIITPAGAQTYEQYRQWCFVDGTHDQRFQGCSAVIEAGTEPAGFLSSAHNNRGIVLADRGEPDRAIEEYDRAIKLSPGNAYAFTNRGNAWVLKGDHEQALADHDRAIRLEPNHAAALRNRCWVRAIAGQLLAALVDCNRSLTESPNEYYGLAYRAFTHLKLGRDERAIADYDAALKQAPEAADLLYGRGLARRRTGDTSAGDADIAMASAIKNDIAADFASWGVKE